MLRLVIDTNLWIRVLLGGSQSLFLLDGWRRQSFIPVVSEDLLAELESVALRPRLRQRIDGADLAELLDDLRLLGELVTPTTIPPRCRDVRDHPVLAAAIDGHVAAIVSGDADLRADDDLRTAMRAYGVELWGIETLRKELSADK